MPEYTYLRTVCDKVEVVKERCNNMSTLRERRRGRKAQLLTFQALFCFFMYSLEYTGCSRCSMGFPHKSVFSQRGPKSLRFGSHHFSSNFRPSTLLLFEKNILQGLVALLYASLCNLRTTRAQLVSARNYRGGSVGSRL